MFEIEIPLLLAFIVNAFFHAFMCFFIFSQQARIWIQVRSQDCQLDILLHQA